MRCSPVPPAESPLPAVGHIFRDGNRAVFRVIAVRAARTGELVFPRRNQPRRVVMQMWFPGGSSERDFAIVELYAPQAGEQAVALEAGEMSDDSDEIEATRAALQRQTSMRVDAHPYSDSAGKLDQNVRFHVIVPCRGWVPLCVVSRSPADGDRRTLTARALAEVGRIPAKQLHALKRIASPARAKNEGDPGDL